MSRVVVFIHGAFYVNLADNKHKHKHVLILFNYISRSQNSFEPTKVINDPKTMSKSNVRIEGNIKSESCSTTWLDPKTVYIPFLDPKNSPLGPKSQKEPKN